MRKNRKYTAEFKILCVKEVLKNNKSIREVCRKHGMSNSNLERWIKNYQEYKEQYFYEEHRGSKTGNPYAALNTSKSLSKEERLELENIKLKIENERLKKGYIVKGDGVNKEFVTIKDVNMK